MGELLLRKPPLRALGLDTHNIPAAVATRYAISFEITELARGSVETERGRIS